MVTSNNIQTTIPSERVSLGSTVTGPLASLAKGLTRPATSTLVLDGYEATFGAGVYICLSAGGVGKSTMLASLRAAAVDQGWHNVGALTVFEPGAPEYSTGRGRVFVNPSNFLDIKGESGDLQNYIGGSLSGSDGQLVMLTVDSLNDQIKTYLPDLRSGQGAAEGGYVIVDKMFIERLDRLAQERNICLLGTINTQFVSFADNLKGATQGIIKITSYRSFTKIDRVGGRRSSSYTLDPIYTIAGLQAMGYDSAQSEMTRTDMPDR